MTTDTQEAVQEAAIKALQLVGRKRAEGKMPWQLALEHKSSDISLLPQDTLKLSGQLYTVCAH